MKIFVLGNNEPGAQDRLMEMKDAGREFLDFRPVLFSEGWVTN